MRDGGIVTFASGNDGTDDEWYPGFYAPTYAVAAVDDAHTPADFSCFGSWVDISSPGVDVYSTIFQRSGGYGAKSGTSMACPMVSGALALLMAYRPNLNRDQYIGCLENTATDLNSNWQGWLRGRRNKYGAGVIAPAAALECVGRMVGDPFPPRPPTSPPTPPDAPPLPPAPPSIGKTTHEEKDQSDLPLIKEIKDEDASNEPNYHLIFSTDCSRYQHWQAYLLFHSAFKVKQPGTVTRIVSGCSEEEGKAEKSWHNDNISDVMGDHFKIQLSLIHI